MNPLFRSPQTLNPIQRIGQVVNDVRMLQQNPNQMAQYLSDHGMISKDQVNAFQNMSPAQMGQHLMQSGVMPQQRVMQAYQNVVPTIKNNL